MSHVNDSAKQKRIMKRRDNSTRMRRGDHSIRNSQPSATAGAPYSHLSMSHDTSPPMA